MTTAIGLFSDTGEQQLLPSQDTAEWGLLWVGMCLGDGDQDSQT